jgi:hypothetical protein
VSRSLGRTIILTAALTFTASCSFEPAGETSIQAPAFYREWWSRTEACSGLTGDFDTVRWFAVPGHGFECPSGTCAGRWERGHRIFISADFESNELVVRHEMLHELIGHGGHPNPPFGPECPLTWSSWQGAVAGIGSDASPGDPVNIDQD